MSEKLTVNPDGTLTVAGDEIYTIEEIEQAIKAKESEIAALSKTVSEWLTELDAAKDDLLLLTTRKAALTG